MSKLISQIKAVIKGSKIYTGFVNWYGYEKADEEVKRIVKEIEEVVKEDKWEKK